MDTSSPLAAIPARHTGEGRTPGTRRSLSGVIDAQPAPRSRLGFRDGDRGTHASRTMMLAELRALFDACPPTATSEAYRAAIIEENILGRGTGEARRVTAQKLRELYGLGSTCPPGGSSRSSRPPSASASLRGLNTQRVVDGR